MILNAEQTKDLRVRLRRPGRPPAIDPPELVARIRDLAAAGHTDEAIGRRLGMPRSTVATVRARNNIPASGPPGRRPRWHPRTIDEIRRLAGNGHSDGQIANAVGLSRGQVWWMRTRNAIPAGRPPGRPPHNN